MSGMDVIGIATGIITLLSKCIEIGKAAEHVSGLPPAFRDIAARLPLIQHSFVLARLELNNAEESSVTEGYSASLRSILESAEAKALALHGIFEDIRPPSLASRRQRYLQALRTVPKADMVERLVDGITKDLNALTANYVIKNSSRAQSQDNLERDHAVESSLSLRNNRGGIQYVHNGAGNQNVATGRATQINGPAHGSTFNFIHK